MTQTISHNPDPAHGLSSPASSDAPEQQKTRHAHASCASWNGLGVLLLGPSGSGKSSLLLRLIDSGFDLVGDDRIVITDHQASPARNLEGLIEVRGLGIVRLPYLAPIPVALIVDLAHENPPIRLPEKAIDRATGAWRLTLNGFHADSVAIIRTTLRCISGDFTLVCGINGA
ncbi:HPr kinase/phosphorylase [Asaia astilbis]|uniref:HPr kinase/phosphorylase n=1 Tax=Asaia astilbis TaxID=610244 RepID=UPI0004718B6A|nr:HPr kinase/phosphatase C-terminal domain-containing protein [Asaia astilbis]